MVAIIIIGAASFSYQQLFEKKDDNTKIPELGVRDEIFVKTTGLNEFFLRNIRQRNILLIVCSFMMDVMMLVGVFRWGCIGDSWRFILAQMGFYGLRFALQDIWFVQYPDGYNWGYPGIMSIFVPYGETADFFYSGHVGVCMIQFLEFRKCEWHYWSYFALSTLFMQFIMMISLRSHYTVDMIAGLIFAHYFFMLADEHSFVIDWYVFGFNKQTTAIAQKVSVYKEDQG